MRSVSTAEVDVAVSYITLYGNILLMLAKH
jgi:hypothetical protein